ncbi:uncharacterized protein LOC8042452 [Ixodes scapularis]|uniref:uncharacterized protein LOC8042452 n=1 Tax=Ixodes scapularis TaxID=6945 RepID=UPI001C38B2B6|nr:uncharacterized protein LOC8042452 [Ixodes scapularis]
MGGGDLCCVVGCRNRKGIEPGLSYFSFPKNDRVRGLWLHALSRTGWVSTGRSRVCSDHFTEECFDETAKFCAQFGLPFRRRLKPDSVPTVFDEKRPPPVPCGAYAKKRLEICNDALAATSLPSSVVTKRQTSKHEVVSIRRRGQATDKCCQVELHGVDVAVQTEPLKTTGVQAPPVQCRTEDESCERLHSQNCVVDEHCLTQLLERCPVCCYKSEVEVTVVGALVKATIFCPWRKHVSYWCSQPLERSPTGCRPPDVDDAPPAIPRKSEPSEVPELK